MSSHHKTQKLGPCSNEGRCTMALGLVLLIEYPYNLGNSTYYIIYVDK